MTWLDRQVATQRRVALLLTDRLIASVITRLWQTRQERVKTAPHAMPVKRLDDVKAARDLDLAYAAS